MSNVTVTREMLTAKYESFLPHLDERQRRLYLGAEAQALGHGGIRLVAGAAGVREATVSLGARELEAGAGPLGRARRPGGGRKRLTDLDPGLVPALLALVAPEERGDPMSQLRWTVKSTRTLAGELTRQGHKVSADTVGSLLRAEGFSLQGNAKTIEGRQHPDRDAQFRYINEQARAYCDAAEPVISVDTKKREQVGLFGNAGRQWRRKGSPARVSDHDFPSAAEGTAIPYGIYDLTANAGWVNVGTDHDTAAFAVASIRRWWDARGSRDYPRARRLLSHITMNWRGRPLTSHQVAVSSIAATATRTGLTVHAELDTGSYPTGVKISNAQLDALPLTRHDWHGTWNYTLAPQPGPAPPAPPPAPPRPGLAWLCHPALTGLTARDLDALTAALAAPAAALREAALHRRRGYRPR